MNEFKNAIGYIRVSTKAQAEDDKFGIDSQKQEILLYANKKGYHIVDWKIDTESGAKDDRPALNEILYGENVTNPPFEAVIAFKNDRVARRTRLYFYYLYVLEKRNIKLLSTVEDFEDDGMADVYRLLLQFVAEQERKNIALRTSKGRSIKAQCGGYSGGRVPYGYSVVDGVLVINKKERPVVELIFEETKKKTSMLAITGILEEKGYQTRKGGRFQVSTIKSIISNRPLYEGMYKYGKEMNWVKGVHEPILKSE